MPSSAFWMRNLFARGHRRVHASSKYTASDEEFDDKKFPMWVIPVSKAVEVTARDDDLPCHEDLMAENLLVEYDPSSMGSCVFFSHTWLRFSHPDSADGVKKALLHSICSGICKGEVGFAAYWFQVVAHGQKDVSPKAVREEFEHGYVWLDYWSIPQRDHSSQGLAIQSIPYYVASTHAFVVLAGPWVHENGSVRDLLAWNGRGWCRMEQVSNALSPLHKDVVCAQSRSSVRNFGPCEVLGRCWFNEVVGKGSFTVEADKAALRPVIHGLIQRRQRQALRDGDLVWYRALRALTTTILMGTGHEEGKPPPLDVWLAEMRFASATDGERTGHSPLRYAVLEGRVDLVRELLGRGAQLECPIRSHHEELMFNMMPGSTILHTACMSQHGEAAGECVKLLLDAGANARARASAQRWTPLHLAMSAGCVEGIRAMMAHDPSLSAEQIAAGIRPFERCAVGGNESTMRWILEHYPSYVLPSLPRVTPCGATWCFMACLEENSAELLRLLIDRGADPNVDVGWLPAQVANKPPVRFLMTAAIRAKVQGRRPNGLHEHFGSCLKATCLHAACITGNLRSLEVLLDAGVQVSGPRLHLHMLKCTPLHCAAMGGHAAVVERLLKANPEMIRLKDKKGRLPSWWAARRGHAGLAASLKQLEEAA